MWPLWKNLTPSLYHIFPMTGACLARPVLILISFVQGEFTENGSETHFAVENHECCIKATSSGRKRNGIVHSLLVDGIRIEEAIE